MIRRWSSRRVDLLPEWVREEVHRMKCVIAVVILLPLLQRAVSLETEERLVFAREKGEVATLQALLPKQKVLSVRPNTSSLYAGKKFADERGKGGRCGLSLTERHDESLYR